MKTNEQNTVNVNRGNNMPNNKDSNKLNQSKDNNSLSHKKQDGKGVYIKNMPHVDVEQPGIL